MANESTSTIVHCGAWIWNKAIQSDFAIAYLVSTDIHFNFDTSFHRMIYDAVVTF